MQQLKERIFTCLSTLKGSGKFASVHTADFLLPGLEVETIGEISYPVNTLQAKALIATAQKAPFGKGREKISAAVYSYSPIPAPAKYPSKYHLCVPNPPINGSDLE